MIVELHDSDLLPEYKGMEFSQVGYENFNEDAKQGIRLATCAKFYRNRNKVCKKIEPPK